MAMNDVTAPSSQPGHTVMFIHGAGLSGAMWTLAREAFAPTYRCLSPDLPGHGGERSRPYSLDAAADALERELAGIESISLYGESLGGYTAMYLARRLGPRLKSMVISGASSVIAGRNYLPFAVQIALTRALRALLGAARVDQAVARKVEGQLPPRLGAAVVAGGVQLQGFYEGLAALRGRDFRPDIAGLDLPILFVNGERDRGHCRGEAAFRAVVPRSESYRLAGVGHGVSLYQSAQVAAVAREFIDRSLGAQARAA